MDDLDCDCFDGVCNCRCGAMEWCLCAAICACCVVHAMEDDDKPDECCAWCGHPSLFPSLSETAASICYCLNCVPFTAGWGTMLSACLGKKHSSSTGSVIFVGLL